LFVRVNRQTTTKEGVERGRERGVNSDMRQKPCMTENRSERAPEESCHKCSKCWQCL